MDKNYFLMYKQADHGEISFFGDSKPVVRWIPLKSKDEQNAISEASLVWEKLCEDTRLAWAKVNEENAKISKINEKFRKSGQIDKIVPLRQNVALPERKPTSPELVVKIKLF